MSLISGLDINWSCSCKDPEHYSKPGPAGNKFTNLPLNFPSSGVFTVYSIQYTVYSIQYIVYSIQYTVYNMQYTVYSIQYTVYSLQNTVYCIQQIDSSTIDGNVEFVIHSQYRCILTSQVSIQFLCQTKLSIIVIILE